jgi:hypothetical protein
MYHNGTMKEEFESSFKFSVEVRDRIEKDFTGRKFGKRRSTPDSGFPEKCRRLSTPPAAQETDQGQLTA